MKLKMVSLLLFCPSRSIRPMRWFFFAGFQGNSKLISVSATWRLSPEPPASVDRKTLQCSLVSNLRISSPRNFTDIFPFSSAKPMLFSRRRRPINLCTFTHSEKMITFRFEFFRSSCSSKMFSSSAILGDSLVSSSIR